MVRAAFIVSLHLWPDVASAEPSDSQPEEGWMVIIAGDTDPAKAAEMLRRYQQAGPSVGAFPTTLDSSTVKGLRPGYHIVVAGIPRDPVVARRMAGALGRRWEGAYVREVTVAGVEDVSCDADPRCVPALQVVGLAPGDGTSMNGTQLSIRGDPWGPASEWTALGVQEALPGLPMLYEVHPGGGEGDCTTRMLQFEVAGTPASRLFFDSYCFGDTSEVSTEAVALQGEAFALRTEASGLRDARMNDRGEFEGTPYREQTDIVFAWREGLLSRSR